MTFFAFWVFSDYDELNFKEEERQENYDHNIDVDQDEDNDEIMNTTKKISMI